MKRMVLTALLVGCVSTAISAMSPMTQVVYEVEELGVGRWQYTYAVTNLNLTWDGSPKAIREFTIWFDESLYDNLAITTLPADSAGWDELVFQPEPVLGDAGAYDAQAYVYIQGILIGDSASGFSVAFDWLGKGRPGSQIYEIVDSSTFTTIESGYTIPEPMTAMLLGLGAIGLLRKRRT